MITSFKVGYYYKYIGPTDFKPIPSWTEEMLTLVINKEWLKCLSICNFDHTYKKIIFDSKMTKGNDLWGEEDYPFFIESIGALSKSEIIIKKDNKVYRKKL